MLRIASSFLLGVLLASAATADDGPLSPTKRIGLFNGRDLSGWEMCLPGSPVDPKTVWSVSGGVIHCTGTPNGYLRTNQAYTCFKLHVEWRWSGKPGNSGVLLFITGADKVWPKCIEAQLMHANAGDIYSIDGTKMKELPEKDRHIAKMKESSEKPVGEWNAYDITASTETLQLVVNGVVQNKVTEISVSAGLIGLQSEGAPIEFKNVYLEPLR